MTESKDKKEDKVDKLLSIIEKQQEQIARLTDLVERTLAEPRPRREEPQGKESFEHKDIVEVSPRRPIGDTKLAQGFLGTARYFRRTPSAPPIIAFMILLIGAALYLTIGNQAFAERLAEISYYMLAAGVVIQVAETAIESRRKIKLRHRIFPKSKQKKEKK